MEGQALVSGAIGIGINLRRVFGKNAVVFAGGGDERIDKTVFIEHTKGIGNGVIIQIDIAGIDDAIEICVVLVGIIDARAALSNHLWVEWIGAILIFLQVGEAVKVGVERGVTSKKRIEIVFYFLQIRHAISIGVDQAPVSVAD